MRSQLNQPSCGSARSYDTSSSLFIHLPSVAIADKIETCFARSIKRLLNIDLFEGRNKVWNISKQMNILEKLKTNILPLKLRYFQRFFISVFTLLKNSQTNELQTHLNSFKRQENRLRSTHRLPLYKKDVNKYSFTTIAIKLLMLFINKHLTGSLSEFKSVFRPDHLLLVLFENACKHWS